jgi:predicted DsbA family dithiol-disulfide isomerase
MSTLDVQSLKKVKLKVEIWSDVVCPWCYIGKRRFEQALEQFEHKQHINIEWKSFQLDPDSKPEPGISIHQSLAAKKGWTLDYARQMNDHVANLAKEVGLAYNFDIVVPANTLDAHRLLQFAKKKGLGDIAEELLFKAYFSGGKNIADHSTLIELAVDIGLDANEVRSMLSSDLFTEEVSRDVYEAYQLGIRSVPFFVVDEKYGVSGAQPTEVFLGALRKAWM